MQVPDAVTIMTHSDPGVAGDDIVLDSEDCAAVIVDPGNLRYVLYMSVLRTETILTNLVRTKSDYGAGQDHVSALGNCHILHSSNKIWSQSTRLHLVTYNCVPC